MKMTTVILLGFFSFLMFTYKGTRTMEVFMNKDITTSIGTSNIVLRCHFQPATGDIVNGIGLHTRNKTADNYLQIAAFYPSSGNKSAKLTSGGQYLAGRVSLTNPTDTLNMAILSFNEIQCEDNTDYKCNVLYDNKDGFRNEFSTSTKVTITSKPAKPDYVEPSVQLSDVEDGQNVTFSCNGIIGNPGVGKLIWRKQKNSMVLKNYYNEVTEYKEMPENCTFRGTSNITIQITKMDHGAVIECTENSLASNKNMWLQTQKISVNYKVRRILITKDPDMERYIVGSIDQINLTCYAEGNPMPTYRWYKESYNDISFVTDSMLHLPDPSVNMTGVYVCTVFQHFGGAIYNASKTVNLSVVSLDSSAMLNGDSSKISVIILCSVLGVIVVITVVVVLCYARNKRQRRRSIDKIVNEESEHETETVKKQVQVTLSSDYGTVHDATDKPLSKSISLLKTEGSQYCEVDLTVDKLAKRGNTTKFNLFNNEMSTDQIKVVKSPASSAIYASVNKRPTSDNTPDTRSPDSGHMTNKDSNHTQDSTQVSQKNKNALDPTKQEVKILSSSNSDNAGIPGVDLKSHEKQVLNLEPKVRAKNQSSSSIGDQSVPTILSPVEKVSSV